MEQILLFQWTFKCHLCRGEFHDCVEIGIHFRDEHEFCLTNLNL